MSDPRRPPPEGPVVHKTLFAAPLAGERRPAPRSEEASTDVTRMRPAWIGALTGALGLSVGWVAAPQYVGSSQGPGPLTPSHRKAELTCVKCHGKTEQGTPAFARAGKSACVDCHGPHPSTRAGHRKLASDGALGCATCHTIHGAQSGVRLPDNGPAVRYGTWGESPVTDLSFHAERTVLVPTIPVRVCAGCHTDDPGDPLARCRSHAGGGDLEATVCFDEHRPALPPEPAAVVVSPRGGRREPAKSAPPWPGPKDGVCADQHFDDRSFAWDAAREVVARVPTPPRAGVSGSALAPLGIGALAGALGYAGTLGAAAFARRKKRRTVGQTAPIAAAAPRLRLPVIDTNTCLGCYACVDACPYGVLEVDKYVAVVARPDACCGLVLCEQRCPNGSLKVTDGEAAPDRPRINASLESEDTPGLFLAGDVTGVPLIKNAILQGSRAAEAAYRSASARAGTGCRLVIVGAGPAGISAALRLKELGARAVVLEQGGVAQSIQSFPRGKLVFDQPLELPVAGKLTLTESSKEELLSHWMRVVRREALDIREQTRMLGVERRSDGRFVVQAIDTEGRTSSHEADGVVVAIGQRGTPRPLSAPIAPEAESRVYYHLADARSLAGQRIVVVGLGDSAMEAAIALAGQAGTSVTIIHRGATHSRGQPRNITELERMRRAGRIRLLLGSEVRAVRNGEVVIAGAEREERIPFDALLVLIGCIPPWAALRAAGVRSTGDATNDSAPVVTNVETHS